MRQTPRSGYEVCYLDGRQSVGDRFGPYPMIESSSTYTEPLEARWLAWARSVLAVIVVVVLVALGVANVAMYSRWHEVEDGVYWGARAEGVTATEIVPGSAGAVAGIERDDVLLAVNGSPVATPADVVEYQHRSQEGTRLRYTLLRLGAQGGMGGLLGLGRG